MFLCSLFLRSFGASFSVSPLFVFSQIRLCVVPFLRFLGVACFSVSAYRRVVVRCCVLFFVPVLPMCVGISLSLVLRSFFSYVLRFFVSSFVRFFLSSVLRFSCFFVSPCSTFSPLYPFPIIFVLSFVLFSNLARCPFVRSCLRFLIFPSGRISHFLIFYVSLFSSFLFFCVFVAAWLLRFSHVLRFLFVSFPQCPLFRSFRSFSICQFLVFSVSKFLSF